MNVPNAITLGRLLSVPVVVWLILIEQQTAAFWVFAAAGISDALDGFIAKRFDAESEFGKFLDPLADKTLLVSVYVSLGHAGYLDIWLVILVVFRDALIVGGAILFQAVTRSLSMQPLMISKVNTAAQFVLASIVLGGVGLGIEFGWLVSVMVYVVAVTTLVSGGIYVVTWSLRADLMEDGK